MTRNKSFNQTNERTIWWEPIIGLKSTNITEEGNENAQGGDKSSKIST